MITNGGVVKHGGRCENARFEIGEYHLKPHMLSIEMGCCGAVLRIEWLCTLGPLTMGFKDLYTSFTKEWRKHTHRRGFNMFSKLLKKGHPIIIAEFHCMQVVDNPPI